MGMSASGWALAHGTLGEQVGYWAGGSVSAVAVADFDQDGKPDIAADNSNDRHVAVLPGIGGGGFDAPRKLWPTTANPTAVAAADLNGDGVPDMVTMDTSSRIVSVLLGNGGAEFAAGIEYPIAFNASCLATGGFQRRRTGGPAGHEQLPDGHRAAESGQRDVPRRASITRSASEPSSTLKPAVVADVNRDGRADILVSDTSVSKVFALYGHGDGTFAAATTLLSQTDPLVAIADFNGDGAVDLVTSQFPVHTVYLGHGDGTFGKPTQYTIGSPDHPTQQVASGDVNGDGNPDLVVSGGLYNGSDRDLWVQLGRGDGTFAAPSVTMLPIAERPVVLKLADVNGDGRDEMITDRAGTRVAAFVADASGLFRMHSEYDISDPVSDVTAADFDGDGAVDLAAPSTWRAGVTVLAGHGDGTFGDDFEYSQSGSPSGVAVGDLNGDGNTDFVSANGDGHTVSVRLGVGDGGFEPEREFHVGPNPGDVALGDFNRDSVLDVVVSHRDPGVNHPTQFDSVAVAFGVGDGSFGLPTELFVQGVPVAVRAVDVNGDGADDIVTANARASFYDPISVLLSNGDRTFQVDRSYRAGTADPTDVAVSDLNGDGHADVVTVAGTDTTGTATVVLGRGDGSFAAPVQLTVGRGTQAVAIGDLNGDGKLDLLTGNSPSYLNPGSSVSVLLGRGDGTFEARVDYAIDGAPQRVGLADMNGDGKLDVVSSNGTDGTFSIWLGNGDGTLTAAKAASFAIGNNANLRSFGIADFDKDGKPDVALADADRTGVVVALQAGPGRWTGPGAGPADPLPEDDAAGRVSPRPASGGYTGPTVSGTISANTTWSGIVVVSGPVTVATGVTLTVQPGTVGKTQGRRGDLRDGTGAARLERHAAGPRDRAAAGDLYVAGRRFRGWRHERRRHGQRAERGRLGLDQVPRRSDCQLGGLRRDPLRRELAVGRRGNRRRLADVQSRDDPRRDAARADDPRRGGRDVFQLGGRAERRDGRRGDRFARDQSDRRDDRRHRLGARHWRLGRQWHPGDRLDDLDSQRADQPRSGLGGGHPDGGVAERVGLGHRRGDHGPRRRGQRLGDVGGRLHAPGGRDVERLRHDQRRRDADTGAGHDLERRADGARHAGRPRHGGPADHRHRLGRRCGRRRHERRRRCDASTREHRRAAAQVLRRWRQR